MKHLELGFAYAKPFDSNDLLQGWNTRRASLLRLTSSSLLGVGPDDGDLLRIRPKERRSRVGKRAS